MDLSQIQCWYPSFFRVRTRTYILVRCVPCADLQPQCMPVLVPMERIVQFSKRAHARFSIAAGSCFLVTAALYCIKYFMWETGYWKTMDIAHDRAGYYLVWGCLNWVPGFYTSQSLYLTKHPINLTPIVAVLILVAGLMMIYINWEADDQRQRFRESDGQALVWGKKPEFIVAKYIAGKHAMESTCEALYMPMLLVSIPVCLVAEHGRCSSSPVCQS